jgi:hypothetical protein
MVGMQDEGMEGKLKNTGKSISWATKEAVPDRSGYQKTGIKAWYR